ncbi:MAG TPA: diacylglycerol kinase family protein [Anaerolineales bacterium]|nr:diacylglycerol kinase family protein [Anaerolineales bacterium]
MKENQTTPPPSNPYRSRRAKLIYNPGAGTAKESPLNLQDVVQELQQWKLVPETYLIEPDGNLPEMVADALARGIRLFVVCGGDGTVSTVSHILAGTRATLGIIPLGTQNNTALSLGIPEDIPAAVALLRTGKRIKVDMGVVTCAGNTTPFMEVCSVGLVSDLFPSADDIQHGNLLRVGDFLATLAAAPPAEIHLNLDGKLDLNSTGYVVLATNMPHIGLHYLVSSSAAYDDGLLDVLFFAELSKLDLLGYVLQGVGEGMADDPRVQHFRVRSLDIDTQPAMAVMVDGFALGEGPVHIEVRKRSLGVMVAQDHAGPPGQRKAAAADA